MGIQFVKDGEPFGGSVPATPDDFDELEKPKSADKKKAKTPAETPADDSASEGDDDDNEPF